MVRGQSRAVRKASKRTWPTELNYVPDQYTLTGMVMTSTVVLMTSVVTLLMTFMVSVMMTFMVTLLVVLGVVMRSMVTAGRVAKGCMSCLSGLSLLHCRYIIYEVDRHHHTKDLKGKSISPF